MLHLFKRKAQNVPAVVKFLLKELAVNISKSTIINTLEDHPDYPNLLSISESLSEWHIENQAYKIEKENYDPEDLLFPFVAHLNPNGGSYILVHEINHDQVVYSSEAIEKGVMNEAEFLTKWSGVALHATATKNSGEKDYQTNTLKDKFSMLLTPLFLITALATLFLSIDTNAVNMGYAVLLTLKLVGVVVSILLLTHSIDANNPLIKNLCSLGKKNNCNAILKSDAAKVTTWLNWSEVGFFYFTGSFLSLLYIPSSLLLLAWLNIFTLPYTVYSLTYQYRHKNWCVLCCTIQALLLGEFLVNLLTLNIFNTQLTTSLVNLAMVLLAFTLPILIWALVKPYLLKAALAKPLKQQLKKFKYNSTLFKQALQNQPKYSISDEMMPLTLGNPNAETTITMVSNPFCGPCAKAHELLDDWLSYRDDIKLKIIFSTADSDDDEKTKVSRHISALALLKDTALVEKALNDWYSQSTKKYDQWALKYPVAHHDDLPEVTKKQKAWCELTEIKFTPTIFIDGYKLPEPYRLEDIKYLLS